MDFFEEKYGIKADKKVKNFDKSRRMFCVYQDKLFIAKPRLPYSHAVWFEKEGWLSKEDDGLMNSIVRGIVNNKGDVYFYVGYDFQINNRIEKIFFSHLSKLVKKLGLKSDAKIFGGCIKQQLNTEWMPRKEYGRIGDCLYKF
jgi:hypothetical protein